MKGRVSGIVCAIILLSAVTTSFSQNYYVVVGAFTTENDDIREFTSYLPNTFSDTAYTLNDSESMLHFYVMKTSSKEMAMANSQKLQNAMESKDSYTVNTLEELRVNTDNLENNGLLSAPVPATSASSGNVADENVPSAGGIPVKPKGTFYKFSVLTTEGTSIPGQMVHQVDMTQGRELSSYHANTYVDLVRPFKGQPMTVVCGVFGYKEVAKYIDYSNPMMTEGAYRDDQGAWVIPYTLERVEKGDVSIMYNVSFYKDAVVMLPSSKNELDELVSMMQLNPNYEIRVHAHCNGKNSRKIIALGNSYNYFDPNGSLEITGKARDLTNLRGEAVRTYLSQHGINPNRVLIYGWGGSEMLVDENSTHAKLNDRIEIEILKH